MYFNNLVRTKRLKYMLTFLVGIIDYRLLPHSDLQLYFDHLENDVGATRYLVSRHPSYALRGIYHNYQNYEVVGRLCK